MTPWTVGACWARERSWSSLTKSARVNCAPRLITSSSASATSAASDSQRSRERAAAVRGGVRVAQRGDDVTDQLAQRLGAGRFGDGPGGGPQLQDGVADFLAGKEPFPAAQLVADPRRGQGLLVGLGLAVGAEEHRDLAGRRAGVEELPHLDGHGGGLGLVVGAFGELRHRTGRPLCQELQRRGPGGVGDGTSAAAAGQQVVGQPHHLRGGAVVADQLDDCCLGVLGLEAEQVLRRGTRKGVDGLAGVADDAELVAAAEPQFQQPLLQRRNVLVFVDDEVAVLLADGGGDLRVLLQDAHGDQQHVLEVDHVPVRLDVLIGLEDAGDGGQVKAARGAAALGFFQVVGRGQHRHLGPFDFGGQIADRGPVGAEAQPPGRLGNHLGLVVEQVGQDAADGLGPEELELAQGGGVEGAGLDVADAEVAEAAAHFGRCPRGEGDGQEALRVVHAGVHPVGDPVRDGTGLAGAGTGKHAHGSLQGAGNFALFGVKAAEDALLKGAVVRRRDAGVRHVVVRTGRTGRRWTGKYLCSLLLLSRSRVCGGCAAVVGPGRGVAAGCGHGRLTGCPRGPG